MPAQTVHGNSLKVSYTAVVAGEKQKLPVSKEFQPDGSGFHGDDRARTDDPRRARAVLSQLSYVPETI